MWRALIMVCFAHASGSQAGATDCAIYAFDPVPSRDACLGNIDTLRLHLPAGTQTPLADCEPLTRSESTATPPPQRRRTSHGQ